MWLNKSMTKMFKEVSVEGLHHNVIIVCNHRDCVNRPFLALQFMM